MTRRRAFVLLLTILIVVYIGGAVIGVFATRSSLLGDIDDELRSSAQSIGTLYSTFPPEFEEFAAGSQGERAVIVVDSNGEVVIDRAASRETIELGRPDISVEEVLARPGETFVVDAVDGDDPFRVFVHVLDDGGHLVLAQPLDELRNVFRTLIRTLAATLLGVVAVLGLMFSWLARLSLKPYDDIVQTADAIVDGDLDRRVSSQQPDPDVKRLVGSINRMLDRNQESLAARTEAEARVTRFAAEASHELRTPLATIAGYSEVYLSGASTDPVSVEKQMTRINGEATRLGRLVESMLTITRLDNEVSLETEPIDLAEVARAAIADAIHGSPDAEPSMELFGSETVMVNGEEDSLYRMFANLLANAQVHAPGADVAVTVEATGGDAVVTVVDNGPGMPPHVADNAFDRFYRGSPTSDSGTRTTGLGLSIAAGIVKAHDGTIELDTTQGEGATFTIRLPVS